MNCQGKDQIMKSRWKLTGTARETETDRIKPTDSLPRPQKTGQFEGKEARDR